MKYSCSLCNYHTNNKKDYTKHTLTMKHKRNINMKKKQKKLETNTKMDYVQVSNSITPKQTYICSNCSKVYKYKNRFSAHIVKCNKMKSDIVPDVNQRIQENTEVLKLLLKSNIKNNELCEQLVVKQSENVIQNTFNTNTINNNQKVNINVFLNNECKDAMNLKEFIDTMNLTIDDLLFTKHHGYIKGITNIFVKNFEDMQPTERPIHCANTENEDFYIKDKDTWKYDNEHKKLNETIDNVTQKQIMKIKDWENEHPNWNLTEGGTTDYMEMIKNVMGGTTETEICKNKELIKKEISETLDIDKIKDVNSLIRK